MHQLLFSTRLANSDQPDFRFFQDYTKLFPIFRYGREYLHHVTGEPMMIRHESGKKSGPRKIDTVTDTDLEADSKAGSAATDDYEFEDGEMGQLTSIKARKTPEQTYR